jgi:Family of unknown function (DUF5681)
MPTDEDRLPLTPVLPWQRPPVTRNRKGQWQRGVSGNPNGRPTKAKLAARLAARPSTRDGYERMKRAAAYDGMTPQELTRVLRATYGKLGWQAQAAPRHAYVQARHLPMVQGSAPNLGRQRKASADPLSAARARQLPVRAGAVSPRRRRRQR